jgi:hypothetical protein
MEHPVGVNPESERAEQRRPDSGQRPMKTHQANPDYVTPIEFFLEAARSEDVDDAPSDKESFRSMASEPGYRHQSRKRLAIVLQGSKELD